MVPLNKSGLVRAKPGNFTLKSLNRCFSNYYQVRTWPVFAGTVTYSCCKSNSLVVLRVTDIGYITVPIYVCICTCGFVIQHTIYIYVVTISKTIVHDILQGNVRYM